MKRQSMGMRRSGDETSLRESKRIKVAHPEEVRIEIEAGSGSDTTDEYINTNGQGTSSEYPMSSDGNPFLGESSGTYAYYGNSTNGFSHNEELNSDQYSYMPNITENSQGFHENSMPNDYENPTLPDNDLLENNIPENSDVSTVSVDMPTLTTVHNGSEMTVNEQEPTVQQNSVLPQEAVDVCNTNTENITECNNNEKSGDIPSGSLQGVEKSDSESIAGPSRNGAESKEGSDELQSQNEPHSAPLDPIQEDFDIENILLCELNVTKLKGHADVVFCVAVDEEFLLSSSGDTTVKVWDVEERKEICNFAGHNAAVTSVILLDDNHSGILHSKLDTNMTSRIAVSASYDCHIRIWSVTEGKEIASMYTFNSITCMGFLEDQMYVVVGTEGGKLEVWDLHSKKLINYAYAHESAISHLTVKGSYVYSVSKDGSTKVWLFDEEELQPLYTRRRKEVNPTTLTLGPAQWQSVAVHKDMVFLGDRTSQLKTLDWRRGRLRIFSNQPEETGICEAVLVKDNILLASFFDFNSDTGGVNVWKLPEMSYIGTLTGDLQEICTLGMTHTEQKLRIVSGGHQLLVWDFNFANPPNKKCHNPYFVCEGVKIGMEVTDEFVIPTSPDKNNDSSISPDNKKSWCSIS